MKLSIVVPVYNMAGEGKLNYCLDSLLNQTIDAASYEIIPVDDKSTDHSLEVLRGYEKKYPGRIRVIASPENRRQGGAKNLGIRAAKGEWLGIIDSDDWIAPDMYEKLLRRAWETGADVVGCDYTLVHAHTMEIGKTVQNNTDDQTGILDEAKHKKLFMRSGSMVIKIVKRQMVVDHELWFPEHIFYEDNCSSPLWMLYARQFEKVNEPLYYYYQHDTSTVHHVSEERCMDRMRALELLLEECRKRNLYDNYREELEGKFGELYLKNTLFSYMQGDQPKHIKFLKMLQKGMKDAFPEFEKNRYYGDLADTEEKKLINYFSRSVYFFFFYYKVLYFYRRLRTLLS
ncbi:MAG: glycosyltransferase family 2 protein [Lachnospiraceae bacterium]|nr:glycosyltransferase family 2 protein [Lachnospiraceae bacterium]